LAPVAAALTGAGVWYALSHYFAARRANWAAAAAAAALFVLSIEPIETNRVINHNNNRYYRRFAEAIEALPNQPAIVFAYYNPRARIHRAVVRNFPDLQAADVWIVHDLGARNRELMAVVPNRAVYFLEADKKYREADQQ
jgi:predicted nucleic acid-binding protein